MPKIIIMYEDFLIISEIKIESYRIFGSGNSFHTEYQLRFILSTNSGCRDNVVPESNWAVLRRYAEFVKLNKYLLEDARISKLIADENVTLPRRLFCGSTLSTFTSVIQHRIKRIQIYLNKLLKIPDIYSNTAFVIFCDFKNRGASGIVSQVGNESVLKEAIAYSKIEVRGSFPSIKVWKAFYLAFLKSGSIFVFESKYDHPEKAVCVISLINDNVKIIPDLSSKEKCKVSIMALGIQKQLTICFDTQLEAAKWTKLASEFSSVEPAFLAESEEVRRSFSEARKLTRHKFSFNANSNDGQNSLYAIDPIVVSGYYASNKHQNKMDKQRGRCANNAELFML